MPKNLLGQKRTQMNKKIKLKPGDLVRMCTDTEAMGRNEDDIDWCYGLYLGKKEDPLAEGFGWAPREFDRVLFNNGHVMVCDHYWHIERVS